MENLKLQANDDTLYTVLDAIEAHLDENDCPNDVKTRILIAVEEIYVNIAHYAYHPGVGAATVRVEVVDTPLSVVVSFIDKGVPYDPLSKEDPDVGLPLVEREIGGLGIYMVKKSMDEITYEYREGQNILRIRKEIG